MIVSIGIYRFNLLFLPNRNEVTFFAAKASRAGFATPQAREPINGRFATAKFNKGLAFLVINGVTELEEPFDKLSTVSANFVLKDDVTSLVSIDPQLLFRYCN